MHIIIIKCGHYLNTNNNKRTIATKTIINSKKYTFLCIYIYYLKRFKISRKYSKLF